MAQFRKTGFQISYITITYRSVALAVLCVILLTLIVMYFAFPDTTNRMVSSGGHVLERMLQKLGLVNSPPPSGNTGEAGPQQAHFTNIDGTVRVKKISTNSWIIADYNVALEKGDVVQTSSQGIAKVVFADGTNYTVKPDSLIVIQENSVNSAQQTKVAVEVTTGTVDLATSTLGHGSKSQVIVAGATATLAPETSAEVQNDPRKDEHELLLKNGSAEVNRNGEVVKLGGLEKVAFTSDAPQMTKTKELGPPTLIEPPNMQPVFVGSDNKPVDFSWTPIDGVRKYRIKISRNAYFSSLVITPAPVVEATQIQLSHLPEGPYYWSVQSIGDSGHESVDSEKNRFTVIPKGDDRATIALDLEDFSQHGHIIEVRGKTEPTARVMVNGQEVALISSDGSFHHFTAPLPTGENLITVTAQNAKGGTNTVTRKVVIQ